MQSRCSHSAVMVQSLCNPVGLGDQSRAAAAPTRRGAAAHSLSALAEARGREARLGGPAGLCQSWRRRGAAVIATGLGRSREPAGRRSPVRRAGRRTELGPRTPAWPPPALCKFRLALPQAKRLLGYRCAAWGSRPPPCLQTHGRETWPAAGGWRSLARSGPGSR